ncbi:MAG: phosphatidate cytidylyltransferase [Prevotellaceae bacterium]|jgi:phosphatidate cytidylyltransferase|nr:phosphatidate cytidylyltransferase [Prevotellaceae bacterium]
MKNLIIRTASGVLFLAIMTGAILWSVHAFWILSCIIVIAGMIEFFNMTIPNVHKLQKVISIFVGLSGLLIFNPSVHHNPFSIFIIIGVIILAVACFYMIPIIELYKKSEKPFQNISLLILPIIYVALPFVLMNCMNILFKNGDLFHYELTGKNYILAFFILIWTNDVGAYCFGMLLGQHGKHKLFPRISPKKTWEGFIGGIIMTVIAGMLISKFMLDGKNMHHWIIIAIITSVFGTFGDLIESMLKRSAGVKDSGKIMPGHGGILDRFDAVLLSFPIFFIYFLIFNLFIFF